LYPDCREKKKALSGGLLEQLAYGKRKPRQEVWSFKIVLCCQGIQRSVLQVEAASAAMTCPSTCVGLIGAQPSRVQRQLGGAWISRQPLLGDTFCCPKGSTVNGPRCNIGDRKPLCDPGPGGAGQAPQVNPSGLG